MKANQNAREMSACHVLALAVHALLLVRKYSRVVLAPPLSLSAGAALVSMREPELRDVVSSTRRAMFAAPTEPGMSTLPSNRPLLTTSSNLTPPCNSKKGLTPTWTDLPRSLQMEFHTPLSFRWSSDGSLSATLLRGFGEVDKVCRRSICRIDASSLSSLALDAVIEGPSLVEEEAADGMDATSRGSASSSIS